MATTSLRLNNRSQNNEPFDMKKTVTENRFRGLWRLMEGFRLRYLGAALAIGVSTAGRTATFLLLAYFVDSYLGEGDRTYSLWLIASGFVMLALVQGGFTFISGALAASTSEGIIRRVRNYLHDHIQRLTFSYHDNTSTGELIQRATSDVDAMRRFFAEQAIESGRIVMLFAINFTAILFINWQLALLGALAGWVRSRRP